ncbi:hypothetical protein [Sulfuricurvum sp.]|uniref:hypothetical protein n=1 Tax=Sulfuricurvum sp. TaxID=2025608 RepID=UPI003568FA97
MNLKKGDVCLIYSPYADEYYIGVFIGYQKIIGMTGLSATFDFGMPNVRWHVPPHLRVKIGEL